MPKNIICSDGTGNTAIKDGGINVFKMFGRSTSMAIALTNALKSTGNVLLAALR